jgi:TolA-binding protein
MKERCQCGPSFGAFRACALLALTLMLPCCSFPEGEAEPSEVEAEIDVGVAAALAEEATKAGDTPGALKLFVQLVQKYPRTVSALKSYYEFLSKNRVKIGEKERAEALELIRERWPQAKRLEDVFLFAFVDEEIEKLLPHLAGQDAEAARALEEIEKRLRRDDRKLFAFYFYVAVTHGDDLSGHRAGLGIGELFLRRGDYEAARWEFIWKTPSIFVSPELHERGKLGLAQCREHLGETEEAIRDYGWVWEQSASMDARLFAAERIARTRLAEGKPASAFAWCLRIKAANPREAFMWDELRDLYSEKMAEVQKQADRLISALGAESEKDRLVRHVRGIAIDNPHDDEEERTWKLQARGLLSVSASVLDLFVNPTPVVREAEDLGYLATSVWLGRHLPWIPARERDDRGSKPDQALLAVNDGVIKSAFAESLSALHSDRKNAARLAAAYLYFAITRDDGGRPQLDGLVSSLSGKIQGLDALYSSREFSEVIGSVSRAARLIERMKAEYRTLVERDIASATDAEALKRAAEKAQATGNPDLAVTAIKRIQSKYASQMDIAELTYLLAEAHRQNDEYAEAKKLFLKYTKQHARDEARRTLAEYLAATCDFYAKNYREAAVNLFEFVQKHPNYGQANIALDLCFAACSRYGESRDVSADEKKEFFLDLTKRFPKTVLAAEAHLYLGQMILNRDHDYSEALKHFQAALSGRRPDEAGYYIGLCYQNLENFDEAEKWYQKVIRESSNEWPRNWATKSLKTLKEERERQKRQKRSNQYPQGHPALWIALAPMTIASGRDPRGHLPNDAENQALSGSTLNDMNARDHWVHGTLRLQVHL